MTTGGGSRDLATDTAYSLVDEDPEQACELNRYLERS